MSYLDMYDIMAKSVHVLLCAAVGIVLGLSTVSGRAPLCLKCDHVVQPGDCQNVTACSDNQRCFIQKLMDFNNQAYFRLGCENDNACHGRAVSLIGKRDFTTNATESPVRAAIDTSKNDNPSSPLKREAVHMPVCLQCCSGNLCNKNGCGSDSSATSLSTKDCYYESSKYQGTQTSTESGALCVAWDLVYMHNPSTGPGFPDTRVRDASNRCRDPTGKGFPWCYTNIYFAWEKCSVPYCAECFYKGHSRGYNGYASTDVNNATCEPWTDHHSTTTRLTDSMFPGGSVANASNYCRDVFYTGLYCYSKGEFKKCAVPECPEPCHDDPATNCSLIKNYVCQNEYSRKTLCPKTCGDCGFGLLPPQSTDPALTAHCEDVEEANCHLLKDFICKNATAAKLLCPRTCRVECERPHSTPVPSSTTHVPTTSLVTTTVATTTTMKHTDPCTNNPCVHGGRCLVAGHLYFCACPANYQGHYCEIDPCMRDPCSNGGTCNLLSDDYSCSCPSGYTGKYCEIGVCMPGSCQNGGTCLDGIGGYKCICKTGFSGADCEQAHCHTGACQNGGTCVNTGATYTCLCTPGHSGAACEAATSCPSNPGSSNATQIRSLWLPGSDRIIQAVCDVKTSGGRWMVLQRRFDGSVSFHRNLSEYEFGFGDVHGEFWLGLNYTYEMMSRCHADWELRIELVDADGDIGYDVFQTFTLGPPPNCRLVLGPVTGDAARYSSRDLGFAYHNNSDFSTFDHDSTKSNCATLDLGGWWYVNCAYANLNGKYLHPPGSRAADAHGGESGMIYFSFDRTRSLAESTMKFRPKTAC